MMRHLFALTVFAACAAAQDDYAAVAAKRATAAVAAAGPLDGAKADRARAAVAAHYTALHAGESAKDVHARFVRDVSAVLTPAQVDAVKDHMTYGVLPTTLKAYREMLPALTDAQFAKLGELLTAGREEALTAGSSEAKHATFGRAKGRANNYLSAEGYDLKQAGEEWAARHRAAAAKKD